MSFVIGIFTIKGLLITLLQSLTTYCSLVAYSAQSDRRKYC